MASVAALEANAVLCDRLPPPRIVVGIELPRACGVHQPCDGALVVGDGQQGDVGATLLHHDDAMAEVEEGAGDAAQRDTLYAGSIVYRAVVRVIFLLDGEPPLQVGAVAERSLVCAVADHINLVSIATPRSIIEHRCIICVHWYLYPHKTKKNKTTSIL